MNRIIENNRVTVSGEIEKEFEFSHDVYGEGFYETTVSCMRLSGTIDHVPIMVSERLVDVKENWTGIYVRTRGQYRSYNKRVGSERTRLILNVFVTEFEQIDEPDDENEVFLDGYICKPPVYRKTPLGREIAEFLLAVNRSYNKSDYIPCIAWGRNARFVSELNSGDHVRVRGRVQSRGYVKKFDDGTFEERTAYEISARLIELVEDGE